MSDEPTSPDSPAPRPSEKELFFAALDIEDPEERSAWLREACGEDERLHQRVCDLLSAEVTEAGDFLEPDPEHLGHVVSAVGHELRSKKTNPEADTLTSDPGDDLDHGARIREQAGDTIGRYKLLQKIGEGGGGVVYMADQTEPVKRRIALKVIKLGMDTRQVVARFEAERQALALMDHPNIAKVLDAGATESGRPYFVMELVRGVPITTFCDENKLSTVERLELFIQVCEAVQHAHQKGIIHRDLKPGNVLVTMMEDRPVPKVIDFGVAKATQQELTEKTLFTQHGHFIGTPAYMSPEQASMTGYDIDTRSDIYALGVLLYELLTGRTPFDSASLLKAGYDEIRRVIAEDDPPKPSTRLSTMDDGELTTLAGRHQSGPQRLSRLVRGDLDWIVMKALEKDRRRRYETANGFARDVQRHLANEPVSAGRPSLAYRAAKFARRNRRSLLSSGAAVLALGLGLTVAGGVWLNSNRERQEQLARAGELLDQAEDQWERNERSDYENPEHFLQARALAEQVEELLAALHGSAEEVDVQRAALAKAIRAEERDRKFVRDIQEALMSEWQGSSPFGGSAIGDPIARSFAEAGMNPAEETPEETLEKLMERREVFRRWLLVGMVRWAASLKDTNPEHMERLKVVVAQCDPDPWRQRLLEAVEEPDRATIDALAGAPELREQPITTILWLGEDLMIGKELDPELGRANETLLRRAQRAAPADFWTNCLLGLHLATAGAERKGDEIYLRTKFDLGENPASRAPDKPFNPDLAEAIGYLRAAAAARPDAGMAWFALGGLQSMVDRRNDAIASYQQAVESMPNEPSAFQFLGLALQAESRHEESLAVFERLVNLAPEEEISHGLVVSSLAKLGRHAEARAACQRAIDLGIDGGSLYGVLALFQMTTGHLQEALASYRFAVEADPEDAVLHTQLGAALWRLKEFSAALAAFDEAIRLDPDLAAAHGGRGLALMTQGGSENFAKSIPSYRKAIALDPDDAQFHTNLGAALAELEQFEAGIKALEEAISLLEQAGSSTSRSDSSARVDDARPLPHRWGSVRLLASSGNELSTGPKLAHAWGNLGAAYERLDRAEEAIEAFRNAIAADSDGEFGISAQKNLGGLLIRLGRHEEAIEVCRRLDDAEAYVTLGNSLHQEGMSEEAIDVLKRARELQPDDGATHLALGSAYQGAERYEEALASFREATRLEPRMAAAWYATGLLHLNQGDLEGSLPALLRAAELDPESALFRKILLASLLASGRIEAASLFHGWCGNDNCLFDLMLARSVALKKLVAVEGVQAPQVRKELESGFEPYWSSKVFFVAHPAFADALREVWNNHRNEVVKRLGTVEVRLIQIRKVSSDDPDRTEEEAKSLARGLLSQLGDGADFAVLAEGHSEGWADGKAQTEPFGELAAALNEAAFALPVGDFTRQVIEDQHAFYLLKVEARTPGKAQAFEDEGVEEAARNVLKLQQQEAWKQRYLARLQNQDPDPVMARVQNLVGLRSLRGGDLVDAKELFEKALATLSAELGDNHPVTTEAKESLARCLRRLERPDEEQAEGLAAMSPEGARSVEEAGKAVRKLQGRAEAKDDKLIRGLVELGFAYQNAAQFDKAVETMREAEAIARHVHPGDHSAVEVCLYHLGIALDRKGRTRDAAQAFEESLAMGQRLNKPATSLAEARNMLGSIYGKLGELEKARGHLELALKIQSEVWGKTHKKAAAVCSNLGLLLARQGDHDAARKMYLRALEAERFPATLNNLGSSLQDLGDFEEARNVYEEAIALLEKRLEDKPDRRSRAGLAASWSNLGGIFQARGAKDKARDCYQTGLRLQREAMGRGHPEEIKLLTSFGLVLTGPKAVEMQEEALELARKHFGPDHETLVLCLNNLAHALMSNNDLPGAEKRAEESLAMSNRLAGNGQPSNAHFNALITLAQIEQVLGKMREAEKHAGEGVEGIRSVYPDGHPLYVEALLVHGRILTETDKAKAVPVLQEVLNWQEKLAPMSIGLAGTHRILGSLLLGAGDLEASETHLREAASLFEEHGKAGRYPLALARDQLSQNLKEQNRIDAALTECEAAIALLKDQPQAGRLLPESQQLLSLLLEAAGRLEEAEAAAREALRAYEKLDDSKRAVEAAHYRLGLTLLKQEKHAEAEAEFRVAVENPSLRSKAISAGLVPALVGQGKHDEAEQLLRDELKAARALDPPRPQVVFRAHSRLGEFLVEQEDWAAAETSYREALRLPIVAQDEHHPAKGGLLFGLGRTLMERGKYSQAERAFEDARAHLAKKPQARETPEFALVILSIGNALRAQGRYQDAEAHLREAVKMMAQINGEDEISTLTCRFRLGWLRQEQGQDREAITIFREILEVLNRKENESGREIASTVAALAESLAVLGQFEEAENYIKRALEIRENLGLKEHSGAEFVLATIRRDQGRFDEADQLFEAALEAADAKLEAGHPERAPVRIEFARSLARQGKFEAALDHGALALEIQQNALRAGHPVLEETFALLSEIHAGLGNTEKVAEYARSADQLRAERRKDNSNR